MWLPPNSFFSVALVAAYNILSRTCWENIRSNHCHWWNIFVLVQTYNLKGCNIGSLACRGATNVYIYIYTFCYVKFSNKHIWTCNDCGFFSTSENLQPTDKPQPESLFFRAEGKECLMLQLLLTLESKWQTERKRVIIYTFKMLWISYFNTRQCMHRFCHEYFKYVSSGSSSFPENPVTAI